MSDFADLDGAMRQRRQDMEENSSSDSQAPDYKIADLPLPHFLDALKQKGSPSSPEQKHKVKKQHPSSQNSNKKQQSRSSPEVVIDSRIMKPVSLNTLLIIYMVLVCVLILSSGFLAFRIVSLEQKLTTLGSVAEFTHHGSGFPSGSADVNTELFSELLTINLLKLEKVQQNLQRLLEEAA